MSSEANYDDDVAVDLMQAVSTILARHLLTDRKLHTECYTSGISIIMPNMPPADIDKRMKHLSDSQLPEALKSLYGK